MTKIKIPSGYVRLKTGEIIQIGDKYYHPMQNLWMCTENQGSLVAKICYIRKIK